MPITNLQPVVHPAQPAVTLDLLAVDGLAITSGAAIDAPARLEVSLRPYAEVETADEPPAQAYLSAPNLAPQTFVIEDVYVWVAARAAAGDSLPGQVLALLVQAVGEEYARRNAPQP